MGVEQLVRRELVVHTQAFGYYFPWCHIVHHNPYSTLHVIEPRNLRKEAGS
jgi:hypothetical protein